MKRRYDALVIFMSLLRVSFKAKDLVFLGFGRQEGASSKTSLQGKRIKVALCITGALRNCRWKLGSAWERRKDPSCQ